MSTTSTTTSALNNNTAVRPRSKTKVIVRKLPYNLSEEDFKKTIETHLAQVNFYYYQPGKKTLTREIPSRAYLNFVSFDALHKFHQMYNGHAFVDSKGIEHKAQLEWAPYQRVELAAAPRDPLLNTISTEPDYIAFVQGPAPDEHVTKRGNVPPAPPTSTPLLDELRAKAQKQRQRQAERNARRNNRRGKRDNAANNSTKSEANNSNTTSANTNNMYKRVLKKNAVQSGGQTPHSGGQSQPSETAPKKSQRRERPKKGNGNANKPKPVQPKTNSATVPPAPATAVPPVPVTPKLLSRPKISLSSAEFVPKHMTPPPAQYKNFLE